jgi:hypothetical protein
MKKLVLSIIIAMLSVSSFGREDERTNFTSLQAPDKPAGEQDSVKERQYHSVFLFDPSGFLLFGPSIHIEPAINKNLSINAGLRFHNLGLLQTSVNGSMNWSYMLHGELRIYPVPKIKIDRFFFGPGFEYGRSNYSGGNKYNARALGGELGYRWIFKNGFCFEICDMIGVVQSKRIAVSYATEWHTDMFAFYMLSVKIGIAF